jgi:hypothetical protein
MALGQTLRVIHVAAYSLDGRKIVQISILGECCRESAFASVEDLRVDHQISCNF